MKTSNNIRILTATFLRVNYGGSNNFFRVTAQVMIKQSSLMIMSYQSYLQIESVSFSYLSIRKYI